MGRQQHSFPAGINQEQAERLAAGIRRTRPKTPTECARFLGYNVPQRPSNGRPDADWVREVEAAINEWADAVGLELYEDFGRTTAKHGGDIERNAYYQLKQPQRPPHPLKAEYEQQQLLRASRKGAA